MNLWLVSAESRLIARAYLCLVQAETKGEARQRFNTFLRDKGEEVSSFYEPSFELIEVYEGMVRQV